MPELRDPPDGAFAVVGDQQRANGMTLREHALRVAERTKAELGDERGLASPMAAGLSGRCCRSRRAEVLPPLTAAMSALG